MVYSMTGFGASEVILPGKKLSFEIRSLNSKQLDINMRLPSQYKNQEIALRKIINKKLRRGKVDVYLNIEVSGEEGSINFNKSLMKAYAGELKSFCDEMDLPQNEILRTVVMLPNIMVTDNTLSDGEIEALANTCSEALDGLKNYRKEEGAILEQDFIKRINLILSKLKEVTILDPKRIEHIRERILTSLEKNYKEISKDENRFEQELIFYIEKLDVTEELVRLENNCKLFLAELEKNDTIKGKKLNFICQEIGREINTIGSKANNKDIQILVVEMKDELEKVKEQLLNVL